jgi:hypothetical protein
LLRFRKGWWSSAQTEIYLNEAVHYPRGYNCTVVPAAGGKCVSGGKNRAHVVAAPGFQSLLTVSIVAL